MRQVRNVKQAPYGNGQRYVAIGDEQPLPSLESQSAIQPRMYTYLTAVKIELQY